MSHETTLPQGSDKFRGTGPSALARSIWAKAGPRAQEWLPLVQHMLDSEAMAERLYDQWLAPGIRQRWAQAFPGGDEDARATFVFLATVHDIGKASPVFVAQVETLAQRVRDIGLDCQHMDELRDDRVHLPHGTVSFLELRSWLEARGAARALADQLAGIVGAHHGRPVGNPARCAAKGRDWAMGGDAWADVRQELLDWIDERQGFSDRIAAWAGVRVPLPVQVGMCGMVIMADWLASNQDFFALRPAGDDLSPSLLAADELSKRWDWGWGEVAMPNAWVPPMPPADPDALYRARFGWDDEISPRPLQSAVAVLVREQDVSMLIIESGMGSGKTEAAFAAGEIMAAKWGAQGLFVALPTQATTDAMFARMLPWLDRLPEEPDDIPAWAMTLAHGKASLNSLYAEHSRAVDDFIRRNERGSQEADRAHAGVGGVHDDENTGHPATPVFTNAVAHQWFRGRKRRLLANFGIGTIDQILMAGLQQRHLMLRHLALAGKVIIIDEVHASDDFMNVYLDSVLHWLGHYGVPVILLSATLTIERKRAMLAAYAPDAVFPEGATGYPLLTWVDALRVEAESRAVPDHTHPRQVNWDWVAAEDEHLVQIVEDELRDGGCALVVRNTVKDAQRLARHFEVSGVIPEVILAHSRFLAADRAANDALLLRLFGPESGRGSRPHRAVVVATQVVEQSLDVDFDVLVTDLAPMDLLFQRIGRIHRHAWRARPCALAKAQVRIIAETRDGVRTGSQGSAFVYGDNALLRTAFVLDEHGHTLTLPTDIAPLVERAIGGASLPVPSEAEEAFKQARKKAEQQAAHRRRAAQGARLNDWDPDDTCTVLGEWVDFGTDPSEARIGAMVRDAKPSLEVIVVPVLPDGSSALVPPWMDDPGTLDTSSMPDDDTARRVATWTVKLPPSLTISPERLDATLRELQDNHARGWPWHRHRLIKGEPILPMFQTTEGSDTLEATLFAGTDVSVRLRYTPEQGLEEVNDDVRPDH